MLYERGGPEQSWIGTAGAAEPETREDENISKRSTLVGYVSEYGNFYRGRSVRKIGGGTYDPSNMFWNIKHRNGCNGGLEYALRRMFQANMDLGVFQETKPTKRIYTRDSSG